MNRQVYVRWKPPVILLGLIVFAALLHFLTPLGDLLNLRSSVAGGLLLAGGVLMMAWAQMLFRKAGTTIIPAEKPLVFVANGPYRFTRNPMYVAGSLLTLGLAFLVGSLPFFLVWAVMFMILSFVHIPFEEQQMTEEFGSLYLEYTKKVRRWL